MTSPWPPPGEGAISAPEPTPPPGPTPPPDPPTANPRVTRRAAQRARTVALQDQDKIQQASRSVGLTVALTAAGIVVLSTIVVIAMAIQRAVRVNIFTPQFPPSGHGGFFQSTPRWGYVGVDDIVWVVALLAVISVILTGVVGWWAARRAVKPLAEALRLQRHFVADASHELRTPLTALSSRIQILQRRMASGKEIESVVSQLQTDADQMTQTLNDLLLTAEGDTTTDTATPVMSSVHSAAASLAALAEQSGVTIAVLPGPEAAVNVPQASLTRAVVAIVDNAIQHSPAGAAVEVRTSIESGTVVIRVRDHGPGITGVDPAHVFDRFAHGTETGKRRSFGLGLALTSEVAHRFGGEIIVESTGADGTVFALSFPLGPH